MQLHYDPESPHRVLVMMMAGDLDQRTRSTLTARCAGDAEVRGVAPVEDEQHAAYRLEALRDALEQRGIPLEAAVGESDPTRAAEREIAEFHPDELIVVMHAIGEEEAQERHLSTRLRERFLMPMTFIRTMPHEAITAD